MRASADGLCGRLSLVLSGALSLTLAFVAKEENAVRAVPSYCQQPWLIAEHRSFTRASLSATGATSRLLVRRGHHVSLSGRARFVSDAEAARPSRTPIRPLR